MKTKDELARTYANYLAENLDYKDLLRAYSEMVYEDVMTNWTEAELLDEMDHFGV